MSEVQNLKRMLPASALPYYVEQADIEACEATPAVVSAAMVLISERHGKFDLIHLTEFLLTRLHSAEARCAELQSHQDDYDRAHAGIEKAERDAARYRWLRAVDNHYGRTLLATCGPDKLDTAIDAEIAKEPK